MRATALQDTYLTKELLDSSLIADPSKIFLIHKGTTWAIKAIVPRPNGHKQLATFDRGLGPANFNTWFLFPAHWKIEGGPRIDFPEAKTPAAANESSARSQQAVDWKNDRNDYISQFFTEYEVTNGDDRRTPSPGSHIEKNILQIARELDKIRAEWGSPIGVTSWNRPEQVNREIGGAIYSQHLTGGAVDIYTLDGRDYEFEDFLDRHWGGGLGYGVASGRGFTHLDLRDMGGWRRGPGTIRWTY